MAKSGKQTGAGERPRSDQGSKGAPAKDRGVQTPRRAGKQRVIERILRDTQEVRAGSLVTGLRKQGYDELPLEEIQDRLSKLRTALAEFIVSRRI